MNKYYKKLKASKEEIERLSLWILNNIPEEIGVGDPIKGESAVDVAIRILTYYKGR